jgi:hypothetical protein
MQPAAVSKIKPAETGVVPNDNSVQSAELKASTKNSENQIPKETGSCKRIPGDGCIERQSAKSDKNRG